MTDIKMNQTDVEKLKISEERLNTLKGLSFKAVVDYEELQKKFDKNHKAYSELQKLYENSEKNLQNFERLYEPVVDEYEKIKNTCELEKSCRTMAEQFAAETHLQNNKLKRQSQLLFAKLGVMDIPMDEIDAITKDCEPCTLNDGETVVLRQSVADLQEKLINTSTEIQNISKELICSIEDNAEMTFKYESEIEEHKKTKATVKYYEDSIKDITNVSKKVLIEYEELKRKCDIESKLKQEATTFATKMLSERDAMKRQSSVLISSAASDDRVVQAMLRIESITSEMTDQKLRLELEIEQLRTRLSLREMTSLDDEYRDLQIEVQRCNVEMDNLRRSHLMAQSQNADLSAHMKQLTQKLELAEEKLRPPPPPMAPPMPSANIFGELHQILRRPKKSLSKSDSKKDGKDDLFRHAIEEMMSRIKTGKMLKSVSRSRSNTLTPEHTSPDRTAMQELQESLTRIKRSNTISIDTRSQADRKLKADKNELSEAYSRIRGNAPCQEPVTQASLSLIIEERDSVLSTPVTPLTLPSSLV